MRYEVPTYIHFQVKNQKKKKLTLSKIGIV